MQLIKHRENWNPLREIDDLSERMNRLFGYTKWLGNGDKEALALTDWAPACDISETDSEYRVHAELPKVDKKDLHVTLEDGVLTIQGERREEKEEKGIRFHRRETSYGHFLRRFSMPDDADASKVDAKFKDGVLNISISKSKVKPSAAKEIAVQ